MYPSIFHFYQNLTYATVRVVELGRILRVLNLASMQDAATALVLYWFAVASDGANPSVTSGSVTYNGRYTRASKEFLGVPYAKPPVNDLRWSPPQPLSLNDFGDERDVDCTRFGPICPQNVPPLAPNPDGTPQRVAEDCLYLNIFAPLHSTSASHLPVMVRIYTTRLRTTRGCC